MSRPTWPYDGLQPMPHDRQWLEREFEYALADSLSYHGDHGVT
jgi:hypothetical protein